MKSNRMGCCDTCGKQMQYQVNVLTVSVLVCSFCGDKNCIRMGWVQDHVQIPLSQFEANEDGTEKGEYDPQVAERITETSVKLIREAEEKFEKLSSPEKEKCTCGFCYHCLNDESPN